MNKFSMQPFSQRFCRIFKIAQLAAITAFILHTPAVLASGGVSLPSSGGLSGPGANRQIDEVYEFGKQIYKGRAKGATKISYCVENNGELKKLKRGTVKQFKGGNTKEFALALVDCAAPDRLALSTMARDQIPVVLYYLNKRYRLNLQDS